MLAKCSTVRYAKHIEPQDSWGAGGLALVETPTEQRFSIEGRPSPELLARALAAFRQLPDMPQSTEVAIRLFRLRFADRGLRFVSANAVTPNVATLRAWALFKQRGSALVLHRILRGQALPSEFDPIAFADLSGYGEIFVLYRTGQLGRGVLREREGGLIDDPSSVLLPP